jgi:thiosulfate/3-mercaptopyruvate sulfurtransferase
MGGILGERHGQRSFVNEFCERRSAIPATAPSLKIVFLWILWIYIANEECKLYSDGVGRRAEWFVEMFEMNAARMPPTVSTDWLAGQDDQSDLVIVDASVEKIPRDEGGFVWRAAQTAFERDGHIARARLADLVRDFSDPDARFPFTRPQDARMERAAGALGISNHTRVIVYDRANGIWAARLWWLLRAFGHDRAAVLDGGLKKWIAEGRSLSFDANDAPAASFQADPRDGYFVDKAEVVAVMEGRAPGRLVCVLRPSVFSGREKVYARGGRIPGSLNISYANLIDDTANVFRPDSDLRASFSAALSDRERLILYCGGGVTAAGSALALTKLGVSNIAVYDGSLNEWSADAALPLSVDPA